MDDTTDSFREFSFTSTIGEEGQRLCQSTPRKAPNPTAAPTPPPRAPQPAPKAPRLPCPHCGKTFANEKTFAVHVNMHAMASPSGVRISVAGRRSKIIYLKLAVHIATHSPIRCMDIDEVLKVVGKRSDLEKLKVHRTKCPKLILKATVPALLEATVDDIKASGLSYSLILDESRDISVKYLAFVARYSSQKHQVVANKFVGNAELEKATAEDLFQTTKTFLETMGLNYSDTVRIDYGGASNMGGEVIPKCVLFEERRVSFVCLPERIFWYSKNTVL